MKRNLFYCRLFATNTVLVLWYTDIYSVTLSSASYTRMKFMDGVRRQGKSSLAQCKHYCNVMVEMAHSQCRQRQSLVMELIDWNPQLCHFYSLWYTYKQEQTSWTSILTAACTEWPLEVHFWFFLHCYL